MESREHGKYGKHSKKDERQQNSCYAVGHFLSLNVNQKAAEQRGLHR